MLSGDEMLALGSGASTLLDEFGFVEGEAVPTLADETTDTVALGSAAPSLGDLSPR